MACNRPHACRQPWEVPIRDIVPRFAARLVDPSLSDEQCDAAMHELLTRVGSPLPPNSIWLRMILASALADIPPPPAEMSSAMLDAAEDKIECFLEAHLITKPLRDCSFHLLSQIRARRVVIATFSQECGVDRWMATPREDRRFDAMEKAERELNNFLFLFVNPCLSDPVFGDLF